MDADGPNYVRSLGISNHDIDLVLQEYSSLITSGPFYNMD